MEHFVLPTTILSPTQVTYFYDGLTDSSNVFQPHSLVHMDRPLLHNRLLEDSRSEKVIHPTPICRLSPPLHHVATNQVHSPAIAMVTQEHASPQIPEIMGQPVTA